MAALPGNRKQSLISIVGPPFGFCLVPGLTRNADIQLNKRLSLRRHSEMLSQPRRVNAPERSGLTGEAVRRSHPV